MNANRDLVSLAGFCSCLFLLMACPAAGVGWCQAPNADVDAGQFATLQEAVDALPPTGGVVRIPPGEYELDEPLRISTGDTLLQGSGAATVLKNVAGDGQPTILIENPKYAGVATPSKDRLWRVQIADLRVEGNEASGPGIQANYIEEIFLHGISVSHHGSDGIRLYFCYEDPRVSDCLITYNAKSGLSLEGCHDIVVASNHFEENGDGVRCVDSFNLAMSGNNLDDHLGDGVVVHNTYGSVIASNMIEECQGWAIVLDKDCYGTTISANVIAHEFTGGIDLRDAHGCAVSANTFTIVKKCGIAVRESSGSITISGNNFSDSWISTDGGREISKRGDTATKSEENPNEAAGILLESCEAVVITGNLFSRLSGEPVVKKGNCREVLLQANGAHMR